MERRQKREDKDGCCVQTLLISALWFLMAFTVFKHLLVTILWNFYSLQCWSSYSNTNLTLTRTISRHDPKTCFSSINTTALDSNSCAGKCEVPHQVIGNCLKPSCSDLHHNCAKQAQMGFYKYRNLTRYKKQNQTWRDHCRDNGRNRRETLEPNGTEEKVRTCQQQPLSTVKYWNRVRSKCPPPLLKSDKTCTDLWFRYLRLLLGFKGHYGKRTEEIRLQLAKTERQEQFWLWPEGRRPTWPGGDASLQGPAVFGGFLFFIWWPPKPRAGCVFEISHRPQAKAAPCRRSDLLIWRQKTSKNSLESREGENHIPTFQNFAQGLFFYTSTNNFMAFLSIHLRQVHITVFILTIISPI